MLQCKKKNPHSSLFIPLVFTFTFPSSKLISSYKIIIATMSQPYICLYFISLLLLCFVSPSSLLYDLPDDEDLDACPPRQIQAFTQFMNEFDNRNCNTSDDSNGVWCNNSTGEVTMIQLNACLSGTLKPNSSLFRFHQLRFLELSNNNFEYSSLPSEFGNLNKLELLYLSSSNFFGQVPSSFSNLTMLSILDLSYNYFSGTLNPNSSLFGLHQLRFLDLDNNNFKFYSLPSEFGNLNKLQVLSLKSCGFLGQVPSSFSNLTRLTEMYLDHNQLTGRIPLVQNLTQLSHLGLSHNQFSGAIPSSLLSMPFLTYLNLKENHLTGFIEVSNSSSSSSLEYLYLDENHFQGKILEPISKLINLKDLSLSYLNSSYPFDLNLLHSLKSLSGIDLSGNNISPASLRSDSLILVTLRVLFLDQCGINEFPNILKSLQNLENINLSGNEIKGKIPEWLWSLPRLSEVVISENYFNGFEGSTDVLVNASVRLLILDNNRFEGELPNLPLSINFFLVSYNYFTGEIPLSICNRASLDVLVLSENNFIGQIPQCLNNISYLDLRKNNLEGSIPDTFYVGSSLRTLDVSYNRLTGKLPRSLLNCSSFEFLSVANNKIKDIFPSWLKNLRNLQVLILRSNKFYGPISSPHEGPLGFPELRIFEIADNKFSGSLPPNYFVNWKAAALMMNEGGGLYMSSSDNKFAGNNYSYFAVMDLQYKGLSMENQRVLTSYATIDLSGNLFEGLIPESIGVLKALIALNLSNNAFTGHIPVSLANLKELESLDLSRNQLSGTIPNGLETMSFLAYINVSHNQLKGEIPQGTQIVGQPKSSFEGNAGLCGLPLEETCFGSNTPPTHHPEEEDEEDEEEQVLNWKGVVIGYGTGVLVGLAIAHLIASYKPEWLAKITCLNKRRNH